MINFILIFLIVKGTVPESKEDKDSSEVQIGLVLSAGAALGLAHIGVLKILEQEQIPVSFISGTSMGSLIGAAYAIGYNASQIESIVVSLDWSELLKPTKTFASYYLQEKQRSKEYIVELRHRNFIPVLPRSIIPLQNVEFLLMELFSEPSYNTNYNFDSLPIPYRAVAVDINTGKSIPLKDGRLDKAVRASIAIPGIFSSVTIDTMELVDGGIQQYLPAEQLLEFNPDFIIGVLTINEKSGSESSLFNVIARTINVLSVENLKKQRELIDVLIEPELSQYESSDFSKVKEIIKAGEIAAMKALLEIRNKLNNKRTIKRVRTITPRPSTIIRKVRLEGLNITKGAFLFKLIKTRAGDTLNFKKLHSDLKSVFQTGFFERVDYHLEFCRQDSVDVIIRVCELNYGIYLFGIRYDNKDDLTIGFEIGQTNLFGSGARMGCSMILGNPNELKIGLSGTRLYLSPFCYKIEGLGGVITHRLYRNFKWLTDYSIVYQESYFETGSTIGNKSFFNLGIKAKQSIYHFPPVPFKDSIPDKDLIIYPYLYWIFNNYDDLYLPTKGMDAEIDIRYSHPRLKSDSNFIKIEVSFKQFAKIFQFFILNYGFNLGLISGGLPYSEYFHTGGENFIGFDKDEFTTSQRVLFNFGCDFKVAELFNRHDYPLCPGIVFNIGNFNPAELKSFNLNKFDYGIGIGLRTNTPVGPFKIIFGLGNFGGEKKITRFNTSVSVGREFRTQY